MIYFNNAATSFPKPAQVIQSVTEYLQQPPVSPGRSSAKNSYSMVIEQTRELISELIKAPTTENIFFYQNATQALNQAIFGLLSPGDHVVTSVTEHNSVLRPLEQLKAALDVQVDYVQCDANGMIEVAAVIEKIQPTTRLVCINHMSNVTGVIQNISQIGEQLQHKDILFLVDASQSLGLLPIDIKEMHIDMLAFTGHKFLYGIQGIGGLYISPSVSLRPLIHGGTGVMSEQLMQPIERPWCFQAGTLNVPGIVALNSGIRYINAQQNVYAQLQQVQLAIRQALHDIAELETVSPLHSSILSLKSSSVDIEEVSYILQESFDINVRSGLHCAPMIHSCLNSPHGTLRISPSIFTTPVDVEQLVSSIKQIVFQLRGGK
ncbi:aminotransferase class V-fold PLP-dependent enzyme [Aliikangiella maris]|uniref:cysteine desulfurase n=2 Tax=Aliikangiella maris TaxID=3162458 RepID=A0ABV3MMV0_9GAMM